MRAFIIKIASVPIDRAGRAWYMYGWSADPFLYGLMDEAHFLPVRSRMNISRISP